MTDLMNNDMGTINFYKDIVNVMDEFSEFMIIVLVLGLAAHLLVYSARIISFKYSLKTFRTKLAAFKGRTGFADYLHETRKNEYKTARLSFAIHWVRLAQLLNARTGNPDMVLYRKNYHEFRNGVYDYFTKGNSLSFSMHLTTLFLLFGWNFLNTTQGISPGHLILAAVLAAGSWTLYRMRESNGKNAVNAVDQVETYYESLS